MRRVLIIGICGAGKSTFSRTLARKTGLPLIHLDREFWQPGWTETPRTAWRAKVMELSAGAAWIMDGNYAGTLDVRLARADAAFCFDYPTLVGLRRALWRVATTHGKVRDDMGEGCPERLDLEFLRYVWTFNAKERPKTLAALDRFGRHIRPVVFRRDVEVKRFLASLAPS
jgi:adenylate kinase family enzyme